MLPHQQQKPKQRNRPQLQLGRPTEQVLLLAAHVL
jgi:hypothetical protein